MNAEHPSTKRIEEEIRNREPSTVQPIVMPAWQPISTVPKDGTQVLCFQRRPKGDNIQTAFWKQDDDVLGGVGWEYAQWAYPSHWMPMIPYPVEA